MEARSLKHWYFQDPAQSETHVSNLSRRNENESGTTIVVTSKLAGSSLRPHVPRLHSEALELHIRHRLQDNCNHTTLIDCSLGGCGKVIR